MENCLKSRRMAPEMMSVTNNPNATKWSLDGGYDDSESIGAETYPYRVLSAGARAGFIALIHLFERNLDYICRGPVQGFKMLLHSPEEVPQISKQYFRVPLEQALTLLVKPSMITTSEGLRSYKPNRRKCYFNSERQLRFFKAYTQSNCELECLSNHTYHECGCVKFSLPSNVLTDTNLFAMYFGIFLKKNFLI